MKARTTKYFWLSTGLALGLHAMLFVVWPIHEPESFNKISESHHIEINLTENEQHKPVQRKPEPAREIASDNKLEIAKQQAALQKAETSQTSKPSTTEDRKLIQPNHTNRQDKRALYKLLYSAINQQKHYPVSALRMKQQGKVRVSFKLFNNGNLDELKVSHSSGYRSLDNAALLAVKRIQPFLPAKKFIARARGFQLDIIFQL